MTQHLIEQEQIRLKDKYSRFQQQEIKRADDNLQKNMRSISCRRLKYCLTAETKYCMYCSYNTTRIAPVGQDYFKPKIAGITFLGEGL